MTSRGRQPTIFFLCPGMVRPSGGVRVIYRHVDILRSAGFSAVVAHQQPGFRAGWFDNDTPVTASPLTVRPGDLLAFPEIDGRAIATTAPGISRVIFNQNAYFTFRDATSRSASDLCPYKQPDLLATIVVSDDSRAYLGHAFPGLSLR